MSFLQFHSREPLARSSTGTSGATVWWLLLHFNNASISVFVTSAVKEL